MNPSYLLKSHHGIYYFRIRIPHSVINKYNTTKKEIRKSLSTRDFSVALREARRWWVVMEDTDYTMKDEMFDEMERGLQEDNEGKKLLKQFFLADKKSKGDSYFRDDDEETELDIFFHALSPRKQRLFSKQLDEWNKLSQSKRDNLLEEIENILTPAIVTDQNKSTTEKGNLSSEFVSEKVEEYNKDYIDTKEMTRRSAPLHKLTQLQYQELSL